MRGPSAADLVVELLRTLDEALTDFVPWTPGGGVRLMPSTYAEGSYSELEARLRDMRDGPQRREWWHVTHRYRRGHIVQRVVPTRKTAKGRVPILPRNAELLISGEIGDHGRQLVQYHLWTPSVDLRTVEAGVNHLVRTMYGGDTTQLRLPLVFLWRLLGIEGGRDARSADAEALPLSRAPLTAP